MNKSDKRTLRRVTKLDQLENRLFRRFAAWTDEQKAMFSFMVDANIREIDHWMKRRNQEKQKAENAVNK